MKTAKLILAGVLALGMASSANAYTLRITGSTAVGAALNLAILEYLGAAHNTTVLSGANKYGYLDNTASIGGSKVCIFTDGTNFIETSMTGSEAGIQAVAWTGANGGPVVAQPTVKFYNETDAGLVAALTNAGTPNLTATYTPVAHTADVAMADTQQSSSRFNGTNVYGVYSGLIPAHTESAVKGCSVVQFTWLASNGGKFVGTGVNAGNSMTGTIGNITSNQARYLLKDGEAAYAGVAAGYFTGVPADDQYRVYGAGRDIGSGTRLTACVDAGLPANPVLVQFYPTDATGDGTVGAAVSGNSPDPVGEIKAVGTTPASIFLYPASTVNYVNVDDGDGGYSSGGNLSKALGANYSALPMANTPNFAYNAVTDKGVVLLGYAGTADALNGLPPTTFLGVNADTGAAGTAGSGGASAKGAPIKFNGVAYSDDAIKSGQYTFWSFEHMYYTSALAGTAKTAADGIAGKLETGPTGSLSVSSMGTTTRAYDGALVTH